VAQMDWVVGLNLCIIITIECNANIEIQTVYTNRLTLRIYI